MREEQKQPLLENQDQPLTNCQIWGRSFLYALAASCTNGGIGALIGMLYGSLETKTFICNYDDRSNSIGCNTGFGAGVFGGLVSPLAFWHALNAGYSGERINPINGFAYPYKDTCQPCARR